MLRHSVLWIMRAPLSEDARTAMLQRLAFLGNGVPERQLRRLRRRSVRGIGGPPPAQAMGSASRSGGARRRARSAAATWRCTPSIFAATGDAFQERTASYPTDDAASRAERGGETGTSSTARCDRQLRRRGAAWTHAGLVKHAATFHLGRAGARRRQGKEALAAVEALPPGQTMWTRSRTGKTDQASRRPPMTGILDLQVRDVERVRRGRWKARSTRAAMGPVGDAYAASSGNRLARPTSCTSALSWPARRAARAASRS